MAGIAGFGAKLKRGGPAGTAVANVTNISGPGLTRDVLDATTHDSSGAYREFIGGLRDGGEITLEINYSPAEATHKNAAGGLLSDYNSGSGTTYALVWPDAATTTWTFPAIVTGFETKAPMDDMLTADVKFKVTGAPTLA